MKKCGCEGFYTCVKCDPLETEQPPAVSAGYGERLGWRDEPPDEEGYWWWWDHDGLPVPVYIAYSGTDGTYFATPNQLGWNRHQYVKDMGGMWMRLLEPETP